MHATSTHARRDDANAGEPQHYSDRAPWLRAAVLGANDGLVSVSSIMLGVGAGSSDRHTLLLSGLSALVAGARAVPETAPLAPRFTADVTALQHLCLGLEG